MRKSVTQLLWKIKYKISSLRMLAGNSAVGEMSIPQVASHNSIPYIANYY